MTDRIRRPRHAGFTLVELLMVAGVSALLMTGLAAGLSLFGKEIQAVKAEQDSGPEEAMSLMTDMARYGWTVSKPSEGRLDVVDALGGMTSFQLVDGALRVTRPSGVSGVLLPGVASFSIDTDSMHRLRDDSPVDEDLTWFDVNGSSASPLSLESGLPVGLGFMLESAVPDSYDVVDGVPETTEFATLNTLVLSLAYVGNVPNDPNPPMSESGGKKVTICHVPPGNPANAHTINISINAVDAHLAHGDLLGDCSPPEDTQPFPQVLLQLFEARAPDDARPVGSPLASMTLVGQPLPVASASWVANTVGPGTHAVHNHSAAQCAATTASGKVVMCHVPPGNPANAHSISISPSAVPAHLAHGDYFGSCGAHDTPSTIWTLNLNTAPAPYEFDISGLSAMILPGRAYSLVVTLSGPGVLFLGAASAGSAVNSGVAQASAGYGEMQPIAAQVPFELQGLQRITKTEEHEAVSRVSLVLEMLDGQEVRGSASVTSQASVPGEWLGAVPGEVADIHP